MEPNPYEPPREKEPLTTGKIAKRGLVGAIILLTPVAVAIALGGSCAATYAVLGIATISGAANTRMVISVLLVLWVVPQLWS